LDKKGQLTATASPAQPRRPEILRLAKDVRHILTYWVYHNHLLIGVKTGLK